MYKDIMKVVGGTDENKGKSYALRLLIHYLGDIHQPMHTISRVDDKYPKGDVGGNAFPVPNHYDADNLHSVWDSVVYEYYKNDKVVSYHYLLILFLLFLYSLTLKSNGKL